MEPVIVIETDDSNKFAQQLRERLQEGYIIAHCNSFYMPVGPKDDPFSSGTVLYVAVMHRTPIN